MIRELLTVIFGLDDCPEYENATPAEIIKEFLGALGVMVVLPFCLYLWAIGLGLC